MLGRPDEALLAYRRALDLDPRAAQHYEDLLLLYQKLGREEELLSLLREQSLRDSRNPVLFGKLAELEERLGFPEHAVAHRRRQAELEAAAR
jgi:tetratricopeptide (TPR) repeat protein